MSMDIPEGHRELRHGEYLQEGDLYYSYRDAGWMPIVRVRNKTYRIKYDAMSPSARHARPIIRRWGEGFKG